MPDSATGGFLRRAAAWLSFVLLLVLALPPQSPAAPGDVYVADSFALGSSGAIFRLPATGGTPQTLTDDPGNLMEAPNGMVLAPSGQLLVADFSNTIWSVDPGTGAIGPFVALPPTAELTDIAFGPSGDLFAADLEGERVHRIRRGTNEVSTVAEGIGFTGDLGSIAVARDGTIFVSDWEYAVYRLRPGGAATPLASDPRLSGADGLALSPDERSLYVASFGRPDGSCCGPPNTVWQIEVATGAISEVATVDDAVAVSLLPDRSLLVSDTTNGVILRIGPSGSPVTEFSTAGLPFNYPHDIVVEPSRCAGKLPTVVGTTGRDVLRGSPFADVISGLGGNDVIRGLGGNDLICAGEGNDRVFGGPGNDRILGGPGSDRLVGGRGNDRLFGGPGPDRLFGGRGNDRLFGGPGRDRLFGGRGRDRLVGGPGRDLCVGGPGRDRARRCQVARGLR